jgi:hypothetical protein
MWLFQHIGTQQQDSEFFMHFLSAKGIGPYYQFCAPKMDQKKEKKYLIKDKVS